MAPAESAAGCGGGSGAGARKAIVIGASSGIGRELAVILAREGYAVGATARRLDLLQELQAQVPGVRWIRKMDVAHPDEAMRLFRELVDEMQGLDLVVISAGTGFINPDLEWEKERQTIEVNVTGFAAIATAAVRYFLARGAGHLVGISSIAALRGTSQAAAYNASKAFASNYLEGLRFKVRRAGAPIMVTDIQPGFVDTAMAQGEGLFWVMPLERAAQCIYDAIKDRRDHAYISRRWGLVALLLKIMPGWLAERVL